MSGILFCKDLWWLAQGTGETLLKSLIMVPIVFMFFIIIIIYIYYNSVRIWWNLVYKEFVALKIQIFDFKHSKLSLKKDEEWSAQGIKRISTHVLSTITNLVHKVHKAHINISSVLSINASILLMEPNTHQLSPAFIKLKTERELVKLFTRTLNIFDEP